MEWPNGQLLHHHASPRDGYDLCYSARPGDPVTLFTARQGLRVAVVRGGAQGVLVRPKGVSQGDIMWQVEFGEKKKRPDIILYDASGRHNSSASILASELQVGGCGQCGQGQPLRRLGPGGRGPASLYAR